MASEIQSLQLLVCEFRYASMVTQSLHWEINGPMSIQDHEFLGDLYKFFDESFDVIAERIVGLGGKTPSVLSQLLYAKEYEQDHGGNPSFVSVFDVLVYVTKMVNALGKNPNLTSGTANLIQGIADTCEKHIFFLKQRLTTT